VISGAVAFDMEYGRWVEEQHRQMCELRAALQAHVADNELRLLVDGGMAHYDDIFRLKAVAAKADVFHLVSGMWKTPAERCFMWMGGFRPSELLKVEYNNTHTSPMAAADLRAQFTSFIFPVLKLSHLFYLMIEMQGPVVNCSSEWKKAF